MKVVNVTEAIVPIYCNGEFNGTGFIYNSFLITAAHVVDKMEEVKYVYHGEFFVLNEDDKVYFKQYGNCQDEFGWVRFNTLSEDLAIYKIETECREITLSDEMIEDGTKSVLYGFHFFAENNIPLKKRNVEMYHGCIFDNVILRPQDYCMYCKIAEQDGSLNIIRGYSGGPLLLGNKVVGMLIEEMTIEGYYHIMKAQYILDKILSYEHGTN